MPACVGVVWGVADGDKALYLVTDLTPLAEAEPYGDCLTHPRGHYEIWETWRQLGPAKLVKNGLPALITWHEYEDFPRGRVVFDTVTGRFTLYADRKLQTPSVVSDIQQAFRLNPELCDVRSDPHYRSAAT